jgi:hypothetical protein
LIACQCEGCETAKTKSSNGLSCAFVALLSIQETHVWGPEYVLKGAVATHLVRVALLLKDAAPVRERVPDRRLERTHDILEVSLDLFRHLDHLVPPERFRQLVDRGDPSPRDSSVCRRGREGVLHRFRRRSWFKGSGRRRGRLRWSGGGRPRGGRTVSSSGSTRSESGRRRRRRRSLFCARCWRLSLRI